MIIFNKSQAKLPRKEGTYKIKANLSVEKTKNLLFFSLYVNHALHCRDSSVVYRNLSISNLQTLQSFNA